MDTAPKSCKRPPWGAQWTVPCTHFASFKAALKYVRTEWPQYQILGAETTAKSVDYREFAFAEVHAAAGVALVLGNEVTGVDATILPTLDGIVEIPMFGAKNTLNVAVCAPIILSTKFIGSGRAAAVAASVASPQRRSFHKKNRSLLNTKSETLHPKNMKPNDAIHNFQLRKSSASDNRSSFLRNQPRRCKY
jgi:tRNA(Leu) C34 or U34 (ribose-2'-O)-methylase TrmL